LAFAVPSICQEKQDKLYCGAGVIADITYLGDAVFKGTTVNGVAKIIGDLQAEHAKFNQLNVIGDLTAIDINLQGELNVKGDATITESKFFDDAVIVGNAKICNTVFQTTTKIVGDVDITKTQFFASLGLSADKAQFTDVRSQTITFNPASSPQKLYLYSQNIISGNIIFASNHGFVFLNKESQVTGTITGAKIIYQ